MTSLSGSDAKTGEAAQRLIDRWARFFGRALIFDFNGTLSNDEPLILRIYAEMFRERLGWVLTPEDYYGRLAGRSDREIIDTVLRDIGGDVRLGAQLLAERRTRYESMVQRHSPILSSTVRAVARLAASGVPLGIVTGAQRADVELVLSRSPLAGLFQVVVTEEDVLNGKPDPEGFRLAARMIGCDPAATLVFEDSLPGVRAAKAAGMLCIAVLGGGDVGSGGSGGSGGTLTSGQIIAEADATVPSIAPELFGSLRTSGTGTA